MCAGLPFAAGHGSWFQVPLGLISRPAMCTTLVRRKDEWTGVKGALSVICEV